MSSDRYTFTMSDGGSSDRTDGGSDYHMKDGTRRVVALVGSDVRDYHTLCRIPWLGGDGNQKEVDISWIDVGHLRVFAREKDAEITSLHERIKALEEERRWHRIGEEWPDKSRNGATAVLLAIPVGVSCRGLSGRMQTAYSIRMAATLWLPDHFGTPQNKHEFVGATHWRYAARGPGNEDWLTR